MLCAKRDEKVIVRCKVGDGCPFPMWTSRGKSDDLSFLFNLAIQFHFVTSNNCDGFKVVDIRPYDYQEYQRLSKEFRSAEWNRNALKTYHDPSEPNRSDD